MAKAKLKLAAPMVLRISFIMMIDPFPQSRAMVTAPPSRRPLPWRERIVALATIQIVAALAPLERVHAAAAYQHVVSATARENVVTGAAIDDVISSTSADVVYSGLTNDQIRQS